MWWINDTVIQLVLFLTHLVKNYLFIFLLHLYCKKNEYMLFLGFKNETIYMKGIFHAIKPKLNQKINKTE